MSGVGGDGSRQVVAKAPSVLPYAFFVFVIFLTLKLAGVLSWSWWWVTSPLWIVYGLGVALVLFALVVVAVTGYGTTEHPRRNKLGRF